MAVVTASKVFLESSLGRSTTAVLLTEQLLALPDWESRYEVVIALGDSIPSLDKADKCEANLLHGCQAKVWVVHHFEQSSGRLYFLCDSDSRIVRGLLACLLCLYSGQNPADVVGTDARPWMGEIGLLRHLASTRSNGLWAMIGKMKAVASRY